MNRDRDSKRKTELERIEEEKEEEIGKGERGLRMIREEREEEMVRGERGLKMIREKKEEEAEDPELAACKQRLREDLHRKRQKERRL